MSDSDLQVGRKGPLQSFHFCPFLFLEEYGRRYIITDANASEIV